jgi:hypothetical protein
MMEALSSSETLVLKRATRRNITEHGIPLYLYILKYMYGARMKCVQPVITTLMKDWKD